MKVMLAGAVATLLLGAAAQAYAAGDAARGKAAFEERCSVCHTVEPGADEGAGPDLTGVLGRKAAGDARFTGYTDALRKSGLVWTRANLDKFLASPAKLVPGTAMPIAVPVQADREDLVAYLATLHAKH